MPISSPSPLVKIAISLSIGAAVSGPAGSKVPVHPNHSGNRIKNFNELWIGRFQNIYHLVLYFIITSKSINNGKGYRKNSRIKISMCWVLLITFISIPKIPLPGCRVVGTQVRKGYLQRGITINRFCFKFSNWW